MSIALGELNSKAESKKNRIPEEFAGREQVEAHRVSGTFVNDMPAVMIVKPKLKKNGTDWINVLSKKGNKVSKKILYLPIVHEGKQKIVVTAVQEITDVCEGLFENVQGEIIRPAEDPKDRHVKYTAEDTIEGTMRIVMVPKKYSNGKIYDVPTLQEVA